MCQADGKLRSPSICSRAVFSFEVKLFPLSFRTLTRIILSADLPFPQINPSNSRPVKSLVLSPSSSHIRSKDQQYDVSLLARFRFKPSKWVARKAEFWCQTRIFSQKAPKYRWKDDIKLSVLKPRTREEGGILDSPLEGEKSAPRNRWSLA